MPDKGKTLDALDAMIWGTAEDKVVGADKVQTQNYKGQTLQGTGELHLQLRCYKCCRSDVYGAREDPQYVGIKYGENIANKLSNKTKVVAR